MKINEVEQVVGITRKNIRFYEEQGLIAPKRQIENGYRNYSEEDVEMLWRIKFLRKLSVPIDEIRKLQSNHLTLTDCLRRHEITLGREEENIGQVRRMCVELIEQKADFANMPTKELLREMEEREKGGTRFLNIHVKDQKKQKKRVLYLVVATMALFMCLLIGLFLWLNTLDPAPLPLLVILILVPLVIMMGVLLAFRERLKEIEGGEEDAASNY